MEEPEDDETEGSPVPDPTDDEGDAEDDPDAD